MTPQQLHDERFEDTGRMYSTEFRLGYLAGAVEVLWGMHPPCKHRYGSTARDAYEYGRAEGLADAKHHHDPAPGCRASAANVLPFSPAQEPTHARRH